MLNKTQVISSWLTDVKGDLVENYDKLGARASGKWADELKEFQETHGDRISFGIVGMRYTGALTDGRKPNDDQSDEAVAAFAKWAGSTFLKDWVENKGLDISPFAVAYSIARKGFKNPDYEKLVSDVVTDKRIGEVIENVGKTMLDDIRANVIKEFKVI